MKLRYWLVIALWILIFLGFYFWVHLSHQSATRVLSDWLSILSEHPLRFFILIFIYLLRPLLLLPITILTVFTGFLWGPWWGSCYALFATLVSASLAYAIGRFVSGTQTHHQNPWLQNLRQRSFETVLISRLIFIPGDLVNYTCGFLKISFMAFLFATALGGLPGLLVGVLAGASIEGQFSFTGLKLNPWLIVSSIGLLLLSLILSRFLRARHSTNSPF